MPHIILEYSNTVADVDIPALVNTLHDALAAQGIDKARIKTRAIKIDDFAVGDQGVQGQMLHATLLLLEGRDLATKKSYGDPLYEAMNAAAPTDCAVTLEIRDMNKDTYYM